MRGKDCEEKVASLKRETNEAGNAIEFRSSSPLRKIGKDTKQRKSKESVFYEMAQNTPSVS